jgi:MFS family permease
VVTTIFSESTPTSRRALFITFGMAWIIVGWVLGGLIPTLLVPHHGWRVCYLIGGVPFLYAVFLYFRMRESAYWLANIFMGFAVNYAITAVQPLMAESYPTEFRNTGVSWCQAFGRIGGALAPIIAGEIMSLQLGLRISFLFYIIPAVVGAVAAFLFVKKETKGRSVIHRQYGGEARKLF